MEYLNTMYNIMKIITCSVFPQANVASNLPIHGNPTKRRKLDREVDKSEYRLESVRLKSFKHWPCSWITGKSLAEAGFYYTGTRDKVKCFECDIELIEWKKGADPMIEHYRWSARCRFTSNISRLKLSQYYNYDVRLASFGSKWPEPLSHLKETLAAAGLFYTGNLDETMCFQCGGGLRGWELGDDPWEAHAKYYENCSYLRSVKGSNWVNDIIGRMGNPELEIVESSTNDKLDQHFEEDDNTRVAGGSSQNSTGSQSAVIESTGFSVVSAEGSKKEQSIATTSNNKRVREGVELCKLCGFRKFEIMLPPCGRIVSCNECVQNMSTCIFGH